MKVQHIKTLYSTHSKSNQRKILHSTSTTRVFLPAEALYQGYAYTDRIPPISSRNGPPACSPPTSKFSLEPVMVFGNPQITEILEKSKGLSCTTDIFATTLGHLLIAHANNQFKSNPIPMGKAIKAMLLFNLQSFNPSNRVNQATLPLNGHLELLLNNLTSSNPTKGRHNLDYLPVLNNGPTTQSAFDELIANKELVISCLQALMNDSQGIQSLSRFRRTSDGGFKRARETLIARVLQNLNKPA